MKKVCICGSFRFYREMLDLEEKLRAENVNCLGPKNQEGQGILGCFDRIDEADIVYIVNPEGYIGRSVSADMGYAYAKKKPIYALHPINDSALMDLIKGILSSEELIRLSRDDE